MLMHECAWNQIPSMPAQPHCSAGWLFDCLVAACQFPWPDLEVSLGLVPLFLGGNIAAAGCTHGHLPTTISRWCLLWWGAFGLAFVAITSPTFNWRVGFGRLLVKSIFD